MGNELNSLRWKQKRVAILKRDGYVDQIVLRETGQRLPADTVHHIFPRDRYPEYVWENWNLISVSAKTHDELHNHFNDSLSEKGERLLKHTALLNGIKINMRTLVVGLPGTGKTTWSREHLNGGLAYDLDYIAKAFTLGSKEDNDSARRMANDLLKGFAQSVTRYTSKVIIIRTAPTIDEAEMLNPDTVVFCNRVYTARPYATIAQEERLKELRAWCVVNQIKIIDKE